MPLLFCHFMPRLCVPLYATPFYATLCHAFYATLCLAFLCLFRSRLFMPFMPLYALPFYATSCLAFLCHFMPCLFMPPHDLPFYATLCLAFLCHFTPCLFMPFYALPFCVLGFISFSLTQDHMGVIWSCGKLDIFARILIFIPLRKSPW